jgi:hypothetical protein
LGTRGEGLTHLQRIGVIRRDQRTDAQALEWEIALLGI